MEKFCAFYVLMDNLRRALSVVYNRAGLEENQVEVSEKTIGGVSYGVIKVNCSVTEQKYIDFCLTDMSLKEDIDED